MFVGVLRITLSIPGARSLKDRRRVVHAFRDRVRARLNASIAEVGDLERHQVATLGACLVARDSRHVDELVAQVAQVAHGIRDALVSDLATEIVSFGEGGSGVRGGIEQALERSSSTWNPEDDLDEGYSEAAADDVNEDDGTGEAAGKDERQR
jgi:uncharacterized protein